MDLNTHQDRSVFTATFNGNSTSNFSYGWFNSSASSGTSSGTNAYSIIAANRIKASEFNAVSDRRIKTEIKPIENSLATIAKLKPAEYTKIDKVQFGSQKHYGFIAQEVEEILPEAVVKGEGEIPVLKKFNEVDFEECVQYKIVIKDNGKEAIISYKKGDAINVDDVIIVRSKVVNDFRAVNYDAVFSVAVAAIQEQQTLIQNQKQEIDTMKSELNAIKDALLKSGIKIK